MAEMETTNRRSDKSGKRMHKKSTRVDLTPMVDLGFLLITFFVFTTTMAKPRVMGIVSPKQSDAESPVCESCALTVIPSAANKIYYYEGILHPGTELKSTGFTEEGLRSLLMKKREMVQAARGNADELSLIIRPSDESSYKNFVDVLDEVNIAAIKRYYIDDITPEEKKLLAGYEQ
jgi:biopolymer transport protein ExbD